MTMRLLSLLLFILLLVPSSYAQKKEISDARTNIKKATNLDKAEASMRTLLKDSANRRNIKIYTTLADAVRAQYEALNEKLYLKQSLDTASLFNMLQKMFVAYESLDTIDAMPDEKGRVKTKYREKNAEYLHNYRPNLYNGGLYFIRKNKFSDAFTMMDSYIKCNNQPLFSAKEYAANDSLTRLAGFWNVFCAHKMNDAKKILDYKDLALTNPEYRLSVLYILTETYLNQKDTLNYLKTLKTGFEEDKNTTFFFTRLVDYYNEKNQLDTVSNIIDRALANDKDNKLYLFAKSNVLLNMGKYSECITICDTLLARNDTIPDIYFNAGVSYINMAVLLEKTGDLSKATRNKILGYYKMSRPYIEKYRQLAPDQKERWASSLYNIYLKLNMGKQFEEINTLIKKMRK